MSEFGPVPFAMLIVIILYILVGDYFKSIHFHIIHETTFGILIGMLTGIIVKLTDLESYAKFFSLDSGLFFYLLLPLIIFSGGYNLKKKRFLQNFKYIVSFGFISTILCYLILVGLTIAINQLGLVRLGTSLQTHLPLTYSQIMLYCATICATDSVAALTLISSDKYPKLFSVVFGEGMINDGVSIILFQAVASLQEPGAEAIEFKWYTPFEFIGKFLETCVLSLLIGLFIGLFSTWCFKKFRFLTHSTTSETVFAFLMAYTGYSICEMFELSGVIALLLIGVMMSHYQGYNISQLGKVTTRVTFESMSLTAEAFIYAYLGFAVWDQTTYYSPATGDVYFVEVSWVFTLLQIFSVILARYLSIFIVYWIYKYVKGPQQWKLTISELSICCFAGMVRGSVAFALIETLKASPYNGIEINQINILQSTVLFTVVFTTIAFGTAMPFFINYQLKKDEKDKLDGPQTPIEKKQLSEAQKIIKYMDENYFKRWFIYDYENRKSQIVKEKKQIKTETLQEIYEKAFSEMSEDDYKAQKGEDFQSPNLESSKQNQQHLSLEPIQIETQSENKSDIHTPLIEKQTEMSQQML